MKIRKIAKASEGVVDKCKNEENRQAANTPVVAQNSENITYKLGEHPYELAINHVYKAILALADVADANTPGTDNKITRDCIANLSVIMFDLKSEAGIKN